MFSISIQGAHRSNQVPTVTTADGQKFKFLEYSPDGQFAIFISKEKNSTREILRFAADINRPLLPNDKINGHEIGNISFNSNNQFVLFDYDRDIAQGVFTPITVMRATADINRPLLPNDKINGHEIDDVKFSKDGRFVSFVYMPNLENPATKNFILRATKDLNTPLLSLDERLLANPIYRIEFSPDEKKINFTSEFEGRPLLVTQKADDLLEFLH